MIQALEFRPCMLKACLISSQRQITLVARPWYRANTPIDRAPQGCRFALPLAKVTWRFQRSEQFPQKAIARNNGVWAPCGVGSPPVPAC